MNIIEQIEIMKAETRIANRANGEGLRNWTPEARAKSLAVRQAAGSVWGWNKRKRATAPSYTSSGYDRSMEALNEDAEAIRRDLASQRSGVPTIGPRSTYADEMAAQRLESFKAWLAEVRRTDDAISDFNEIVAVMGGLTSGVAKAQKGQRIGEVTRPVTEKPADTKAAIEKSIRRNFEKRNADYLRKNPDERDIMLDMVAEKAEYYSATTSQKVQMEKDAYRRIRDTGATNMRETDKPKEESYYRSDLEEYRSYVQEKNIVRPQLKEGESAYPAGGDIWIGVMPNGDKRVIFAKSESRVLYNRKHSAACASSTGDECSCSCGGSMHGGGSGTSEPEGGSTAEAVSAQANDSYTENGVRGMTEEERQALIDELERKISEGKEPDGDAEEEMLADLKKASADWQKMVDGFRKMIEDNKRPSLQNLIAQLKKDNDVAKYRMAVDALSEAYHTESLDSFQDKFERDPKGNEEFQDFQRKIKVPAEFIAPPNDDGSDNAPQQKTAVVAPVGKGRSMKDYRKLGFAGMDETWAGEAVRRIEEREKWGTKITADEARLVKEYSAFVDAKNASRKVGK